jgi:NCS1 family nucleobase:cation symporter-1
MENHLPESAGITSRDLLAFFLFWLIELPFQVVHPSKIKVLFAVSILYELKVRTLTNYWYHQAESIICPMACLGVFAWCISYGGGIQVESLNESPVTGGALGWAMLNGINSCLGVTSALLVNVSLDMNDASISVVLRLTVT